MYINIWYGQHFFIWRDEWPITRRQSILAITIVIVIFFYYHKITYIYYSLRGITGHRCGPSSSPGFGIDFEHSQVPFPSALWSPELIHVLEDFDVRSVSWPERERGILLLSQISPPSVPLTSQHADSHLELLLVMLWQIYMWCALHTLRFLCAGAGMCVRFWNQQQV